MSTTCFLGASDTIRKAPHQQDAKKCILKDILVVNLATVGVWRVKDKNVGNEGTWENREKWEQERLNLAYLNG